VSTTGYYWIIAADNIPAAHVLDELVLQETPAALIRSTDAYWSAWLEKHGRDLTSLPATLQTLYRRSLMIMRVHTDNNGGIIASSDTEMLHHGRDCYSYVWPRDGALIAHAFDQTGYRDVARQFFLFMRECQEPAGYLMHKYRTDGALGSSWHPWIIDGQARLPIQEDETASILFVLWKHFQRYKDVEFVESMYNSFIEPAANFMVDYIEPTTGLPSASFDLWEEKYGTSTYTAASVYAGLAAASKFAQLLGKAEPARTYGAVASRLKRAIDEHLWDEARGAYIKHVYHTEDGLQYDRTIDTSSLYGMLFFEVASHTDERLARMLQTVEQTLAVRGNAEGYMRYEGDNYYKQNDADTPNPWVICTLWVAQFYIAVATDKQGLQKALELLEWTASHATSSGVLAEQMHPDTRAQLSTAPLTWSHAEFVMACEAYMKKWHALQQN
jgi:GH15 family glucan-1,4-alpha-glucosidase